MELPGGPTGVAGLEVLRAFNADPGEQAVNPAGQVPIGLAL